MADSDDSMPFALEMPVAGCGTSRVPGALKTPAATVDPVLPLWRDLEVARSCARKLTHRQQAIESVMMERIGVAGIRVLLPDGGHVSALTREDVRELVGDEADGMDVAEGAYAGSEVRCARVAAADADLGYLAALEAEGRALARVRTLADRLWATPATSLTGVLAKLDALLEEGAPSVLAGDLPWPQLRAIRADLEKLHVAAPPSLRR